jgi:DNA invertase Pin-like site-specific DNA recombinase
MTEPEKTPRRLNKRIRCAIYTRKSTDEGLEQAFNSLDAQREACAAFIQSQKHEGWIVLPAQYDDGGYSGGTMERPALERLLADIEAGQVDAVVVYKVDRLTRALSDFAKLVEVFDRRCVSFVSITQQFNTTTSMGRLTLNVLLSFAQFEREVIGERVRDKIAASKKKGMWMGGMPPLGYDVKDRKLVINRNEARTIVDIYRRYLSLKSVRQLHDELAAAGIRSKRRVRSDGTTYGGQKIGRGVLYLMLQNRIYRGEITHKGKSYPGEHPAIIDQPLWNEVQAVLAQNRVERATGARAKHPSVLGGLVFDATGERLTPTYAIKKGTRYRYYVSSSLVREAKGNRAGRWRIPAGDLEGLVVNRLRRFFADPTSLLDITETHSGLGKRQLIERGRQIAEEFGADAPDKAKATLMALTCRITIHSDRIDIALSRERIAALLAGASIDLAAQPQIAVPALDDLMILRAPARLQRIGRGMRLIVEGVNDKAEADPSLLRVLTRAHNIQERLSQDTDLTVHDVAREERVTAAYVYALLRLPWLAPDITTAIVHGRQPHQLSAKTLMRRASRLPADWAEQRALLGF